MKKKPKKKVKKDHEEKRDLPEEVHVPGFEKNDFVGLPARDLKKNLGCG